MNRAAAVELRVGGHTYRVASSATEDDLRRLASVVDSKLRQISSSTAFHPQSMLLVAMSLAHELEQERGRRVHVEDQARKMLNRLLEQVDAALEVTAAFDDGSEPAPTTP